MAETLVERIWAWLHATFPERQIYVRSEGRVQFFTFGPTLQATLSGLALIFLGWVAFATVNVIFKDRIIASKDHRYQQMRWADENRIADLQQSYDELNGALVAAEDRFKSKADELEAKQETVSRLLNRKQAVTPSWRAYVGAAPKRLPRARMPIRLRSPMRAARAFPATASAPTRRPRPVAARSWRPCHRIPIRSPAPAVRPRQASWMRP